MSRLHLIVLAALVSLLLISAAGCGAAPTPVPSTPAPSTPAPTVAPPPTAEEEPSPEPTSEFARPLEALDPSNFDDPTHIDNPWLPLKPGTQRIYEGSTEESGLIIPHRIVFTVTDLVKEIDGLRTVVAHVVDFSNNQAIEREFAFYAQDNGGSVWYLGEYPEEYENGQLVNAPAWIAGFKGAKAGIKMRAEPQEGTPSYSQGWGPAVNWTDRGKVDLMGQETCVAVACFQDVLVIAETSLEELDAFQLKYYAPGMGEVRVSWRGADATRETLELVEVSQLGPEALAEVHAEVLEQEARAYKNSKEVYDQTPPLKVPAETTAGSETSEVNFEDLPELDVNQFSNPTRINNPWLPLEPGNQWILEGKLGVDGEEIPHQVLFTVTDLVKEIAGVPAVVVLVRDYANDELVEAELAFYAQDNDGNVWYLGEYAEVHEDGQIVDTAWIAGVDGAKAGIQMQAEPQVDTPSYAQGWGPAVGWANRGQVNSMGAQTCVPLGCYGDLLVIDEFSQEEPVAVQLKHYARGVGPVGVRWSGKDAQQEELGLASFSKLGPRALPKARSVAFTLEERAYTLSNEVYGQTPPSEGPQP